MKRRQAIKHLVIISAAAAILPSCEFGPKVPVYENIPLDKKQRKFLEQFTEALLPTDGTEVTAPESATDFTLTVLNDCHSPEDVQKYLAGLTELQTYVKEKYNTDFGALGAAKQAEVFAWLSAGEELSEPLKFFFDTTRGMTIEHFTSSEFFLKNVMDWEFAPGRFVGCTAV